MASVGALRAPGVKAAPPVRGGRSVLAAAGGVCGRCQRQAPVTGCHVSVAVSGRFTWRKLAGCTSAPGVSGTGGAALGVVAFRNNCARATFPSHVVSALPVAVVADPASTVFLGVCTMMVRRQTGWACCPTPLSGAVLLSHPTALRRTRARATFAGGIHSHTLRRCWP